jgi:PAS domain S-box-containing protein
MPESSENEESRQLLPLNVTWALEATTDGVVLLDRTFKTTYANRGASIIHSASSFIKIHESRLRVALDSGIPVEFLHPYEPPEGPTLWLSIRAFPCDTGLAIFFKDVSERMRHDLAEKNKREAFSTALIREERKQRFRVDLSDALREVDSPEEIMKIACRMAALHLNGCRGSCAFVYGKNRRVEIVTGWQADVPRIDGSYSFEDVGVDLIKEFQKGKPLVVKDTTVHPYTFFQSSPSYSECGIRSLVGMPLVKDGELVAVLAVHDSKARDWTQEEIELLDEVGHRVWGAVASALANNEILRLGDRYRALAETSATVVFTADPDGNLSEIPVLRGLAITDEQRGLGMGWVSAVHPDDQIRAMESWAAAVSSETSYYTQFRLKMTDGRYRWHQARGVRVLDPLGATREWIGSCVDIHERVTRTRTLELLDAFTAATRELKTFEEIVECGQRMIGKALEASRVVYCETRKEEMLFVGVPNYCVGCEDLNGKLPITGHTSKISRGLRAGIPLISNNVLELAEEDHEHRRLVEAEVAAMICQPLMKDGRLIAILGIHQNQPREWSSDEVALVKSFAERCWSEIERAKAEQELQFSEVRLRRVLETATVGVIVNGPLESFTYANAPLLRMLGYVQEEMTSGDLCWANIQSSEFEAEDRLARAELENSGICQPYETALVRKDGTSVAVYAGAAHIPDEGGGGVITAWYITDLTDLKAVEAELRILNSELESRVDERTAELRFANKELEGFTYSVSHDLRSPLRSIVATSRILLEDLGDKLSEDENSLLLQQAKSANKLGVLIDDLLKLSRLSRDQVDRTEFELSALAEKVVEEMVSPEWRKNCVIKIQPDLKGFGDIRHIQLLLANLFENACKFSPGGGEVKLGQTDGVFFVSDEGIGFDMAYVEKLFIPFERLVRDVDFPGTGVGLANVQRIVQRHGGKIWVESKLGVGTTFFFTLPV